MSMAERHARVYGYDSKDVFDKRVEHQQQVQALQDIRSSVQVTPALEIPVSASLMVELFKSRFERGTVWDLPIEDWDKGVELGALPPAAAPQVT